MEFCMQQKGYLEIILGPMFSGKTSRIIDVYEKAKLGNIETFVINHSDDTRYHMNMLSTHNGKQIPCFKCNILDEFIKNDFLINHKQQNTIVLINEAQFFPDLKDVVLKLVEEYNCKVIICGLDGDYNRCKFGQILDLIPYCDKVEKLRSFCSKCNSFNNAVFTHRLSNETSQVLIGVNNYIPLCRNCYLIEKNK